MTSFEISKLNNVTVVPIPVQALPSHESNDCQPPPWHATHMPQNKTTNSNTNRGTAATSLAPSTQLSTTSVLHNYWWNSRGYCSSTPNQKIARKHTGKDERKSAKFEHGGTGEGNVPKDHLLKIAIAKQPNEELPCHRDDGAFL